MEAGYLSLSGTVGATFLFKPNNIFIKDTLKALAGSFC